MEEPFVSTLLITANVGSIFEDPQNLLKIWVKEFLSTVNKLQPKFLALHCQEIGGKNYEESMRHVEDFVRMLMASGEFLNFGKVRIYLDEDFTCTEKFTALGNLYFVHNSLKNVNIWDFKAHEFVPVEGKEVHSGNIERVVTKEKSKFPKELFPECKWSRKGFMRTRWDLGGTVFDLINIHLFHDASNFVAMESFPSAYSKNRQNALAYTLHRFATDEFDKVPYFIFGDFNFRLDLRGIVQKLTSSAVPCHVKSSRNGEIEKVLYKEQNSEDKVVLTLEKKVFDLDEHEDFFVKNANWDFDKEVKAFEDEVFEFEKEFPPSYPFLEDTISGTLYMRTRCPAWCDRILLSKSARALISMDPLDSNCSSVRYQLLGPTVSMGDHKPVMLSFKLLLRTGRQPQFIFEFSDLDPLIPQSQLPDRRTLSNPPLLSSVDPVNLPKRTLSCVSDIPDTSQAESPFMDTNKLFVGWPSRRHASHHSSSSEEWYYEKQRNESAMQDQSQSSSICDETVSCAKVFDTETSNCEPPLVSECVSECHPNYKDCVELHGLLHVTSTPSVMLKSSSRFHDIKSCQCCPCVLL